MRDERDARADALLSAALDLPESERADFVKQACGDDEPLLRLVLELLEDAERADDDFLRPAEIAPLRAALFPTTDNLPELLRLQPGTRLGPWKVVRELGGGGMGIVYLCDRADGQFEQRAAVKLIRAGVDTHETILRFQQERQILASLDHPNIARLLDGGVAADGRPFLAMEYIEGRPIDEWCNERRLSVDERLELFAAVGHGVEFAHRHLVIHRDLKPSNILVTERGQVKLLDFGIAKLLDPSAAPWAAPETRTSARLMTPEYASPEQVTGEAATTASDVYQLGLLLYELLCGHRAQQLAGRTPTEIERVVCRDLPPRPSTAAGQGGQVAAAETHGLEAERLRRRLRGDLDNIVMKALRKEPESRYASVAALLEDIAAHRAGRPISARPATFRYLAGRFVRRNTAAVVAASLVTVSILAGLVTSLWLARIASIERDRARTEAATARRVSEFLVDTFELADPGEARGSTVTAVELLDSGSRRIDTLAAEPEVQATMQDVIGRVYVSLGLYEPAGRLLRASLATREKLFAAPSEPVAESLEHLGSALHEQGAYDEAQQHLERGLAMRRELFGPSHPQVADSLRSLALLEHFRGHLDEARKLYEQALEIRRGDGDARNAEVAQLLKDLGSLEMQENELERSAALLGEALAMQQEAFGVDHPAIGETLNALGMVWQNLEDLDKSEAFYRQALDMRTRVLGPNHPDTASTRNNLGALFYQQEDYAKAEPIFREAMELKRQSLGDKHPSVALSMTNLAVLLSVRGDNERAEPLYREALAIRLEAYGEEHVSVAVSRYYLGRVLAERGETREAESLMRAALPRLPAKDPNRAALCVDLGELLLRQKRLDEAGPLIEEGVALNVAALGEQHWRSGAALSARAGWHLAQGDTVRAKADLDRAWPALEARPATDPRRRRAAERLAALTQAP